MTQSANKQGSMLSIIVAAAAFLISFFLLGFNIIISAVLAVAGYFIGGRFGAKSDTGADPVTPPAADVPEDVPEPEMHMPSTPKEKAAPEPEPAAENEVAPEPVAATAGVVKLGTILPGEAELSDRKGAWRYEG